MQSPHSPGPAPHHDAQAEPSLCMDAFDPNLYDFAEFTNDDDLSAIFSRPLPIPPNDATYEVDGASTEPARADDRADEARPAPSAVHETAAAAAVAPSHSLAAVAPSRSWNTSAPSQYLAPVDSLAVPNARDPFFSSTGANRGVEDDSNALRIGSNVPHAVGQMLPPGNMGQGQHVGSGQQQGWRHNPPPPLHLHARQGASLRGINATSGILPSPTPSALTSASYANARFPPLARGLQYLGNPPQRAFLPRMGHAFGVPTPGQLLHHPQAYDRSSLAFPPYSTSPTGASFASPGSHNPDHVAAGPFSPAAPGQFSPAAFGPGAPYSQGLPGGGHYGGPFEYPMPLSPYPPPEIATQPTPAYGNLIRAGFFGQLAGAPSPGIYGHGTSFYGLGGNAPSVVPQPGLPAGDDGRGARAITAQQQEDQQPKLEEVAPPRAHLKAPLALRPPPVKKLASKPKRESNGKAKSAFEEFTGNELVMWEEETDEPHQQILLTRVSSNREDVRKGGPETQPRFFYWALTLAPKGFGIAPGGHCHIFTYEVGVQLAFGRAYSREELAIFIRGRQNGSPPTLRVQGAPSQIARRLEKDDRRCRFDCCPMESRIIGPGWYRVAFDEFPEWTGDGTLDPYKMAGMMHLWCFEQCFDLVQYHDEGRLMPENRILPKEERNATALARDTDREIIPKAYMRWFKERKEKEAPRPKDAPWTPRKHEDTLSYMLTRHHLDHQTPARQNSRSARNKNKKYEDKTTIDFHLGDLSKYTEALSSTRMTNQKRKLKDSELVGPRKKRMLRHDKDCETRDWVPGDEAGTEAEEPGYDLLELAAAGRGGNEAMARQDCFNPLADFVEEQIPSVMPGSAFTRSALGKRKARSDDQYGGDKQPVMGKARKRRRDEAGEGSRSEAPVEDDAARPKRPRLQEASGHEPEDDDDLFGDGVAVEKDEVGGDEPELDFASFLDDDRFKGGS